MHFLYIVLIDLVNGMPILSMMYKKLHKREKENFLEPLGRKGSLF